MTEVRQFAVHARHMDRHHAHHVKESSFEAAAVAFVEDFGAEIGDLQELSVVVREVGTHHEHCFTIDLESGETASCA